MNCREHNPLCDSPQAGLGLMEGIAVLGVMTLLLVIVMQIFMASYNSYIKQSARADNNASAILATRSISEAARGAQRVLASKIIGGTSYSSSSSELVLELPTVDSNGNITDDEYDYIAFYRDGTETEKIFTDTEAAASSYRITGKKLITDHNDLLVFRFDNPDATQANRISVYLKNKQTVRQTDIMTEAWSSIFMRNH